MKFILNLLLPINHTHSMNKIYGTRHSVHGTWICIWYVYVRLVSLPLGRKATKSNIENSTWICWITWNLKWDATHRKKKIGNLFSDASAECIHRNRSSNEMKWNCRNVIKHSICRSYSTYPSATFEIYILLCYNLYVNETEP